MLCFRGHPVKVHSGKSGRRPESRFHAQGGMCGEVETPPPLPDTPRSWLSVTDEEAFLREPQAGDFSLHWSHNPLLELGDLREPVFIARGTRNRDLVRCWVRTEA
jgi:hypothetical protein